MDKNKFYSFECSWCKNTKEFTEDEFNKLPESPGHQNSLFKEIPCDICGKVSFSLLPFTTKQWEGLIPFASAKSN